MTEALGSSPAADALQLYGEPFASRLLLGTAGYPSPSVMIEAIKASKAEFITVALRRQNPENSGGQGFWSLIQPLARQLLPNTAGCRTAKEAVATAQMARELFSTDWIKLEVIGDDYNLQPDPFALERAATELLKDGFKVLPYCTDDLVCCQRLLDAGCQALMPWAAPIGTGQGMINPYALTALRARIDAPLILDAGLGRPSHACEAMEMGFDAVLINTAIAKAGDPAQMARAFACAVTSGRQAWHAGLMKTRQTAKPSTPVAGKPFWQHTAIPKD